MAVLAVQRVTAAGTAPTYAAAAAGGDTVDASSGEVCLHVKNGGGAAITVTVADPGKTPAANPGTPTAVTVPAGGDRFIYVPIGTINPATGLSAVSYSAVTSVTVAALGV